MKIMGIIVVIFAVGIAVVFFESDEKYLKKTTEKLIRLSSPALLTDLQILRRVEEIAKHIHFDMSLQIQQDKFDYKIRSLNEIRSALFGYFKYKLVVDLKTNNLLVKINTEDKSRATVGFDMTLKTKSKSFTCKSLMSWIKEKDWFIKTAEVYACSPISF